MLHKRLRLCAYKVQLVEQLKPGDGIARQHFAEEMLDRIDDDVDLLKKIMFTDEATFKNKTKAMRISRQPSTIKIMIDQKQLENVEYFNYLGSMITNDARCTHEMKSRIAMAKSAFNKKKNLFTSTLDLNLRKKLVKCYIWSIALYGAETWTLRKIDQKYLENFEMWCCRRMEKIRETDHVRNEEVLHRVKEERNILHTIKRKEANWIGHI
jgi:hypothetical protein